MLLDIVTEYNSKVTFLNIQKKKSCVCIKFIGLYKLFIYIYYSKIRKTILFKAGDKIFLYNTTLNSNKRLKKVLFVKNFLRNF